MHSSRQRVPVLYNGLPLSPQNCSITQGIWTPHLTRGSLGPPESITQMACQSVQRFLQDWWSWQTNRQTTALLHLYVVPWRSAIRRSTYIVMTEHHCLRISSCSRLHNNNDSSHQTVSMLQYLSLVLQYYCHKPATNDCSVHQWSNHRYNIKYSLDTWLAIQTPAKGVVRIVCRLEIRKMAEC